MGPVESLYDCTKRLYSHLRQGLPKTDRDTYIDKIEELLEERQHWIEKIHFPAEGETSNLSRKMPEYEEAIQQMLGEIFDEVREDIHHLRRRQATSRRYTNPYQGGAADGMFLDKRK
ncbi:MAG TPA: hypothetical protein VFT51_04705 [Bacillales bacterium]|nr:hypothetical protein [Bacillales bacterium]